MAVETWLARNGGGTARAWPASGEIAGGRLRGDVSGCPYRARNLAADFPAGAAATAADCRAADLVVSLGAVRGRCVGARVVVDRRDLRREGVEAIYFERSGRIRIESIAGERGRRPWSDPRPTSAAQ